MLLLLSLATPTANHGHKRDAARPSPLILTSVPELAAEHIPDSFDWRSVDGRSMVTADVNQHIPTYCGSCWIHGTIAALNDRIKIGRRGAFPDVMLSRQAAMNCVHSLDAPKDPAPGCNGGDPWAIHAYMATKALPDESCQPYEAKNGVCDAAGQCRNCFHPLTIADPATPHVDFTSPGCFATEFVGFGVSEFGGVAGVAAMQSEILTRGPIVCSFAADSTFMLQFDRHLVEGVYVDPTYLRTAGTNASTGAHTNAEVDHDVEVAGWGVTPGGLPYWVVRNSWGTYWGERGWFKILRGANHLFIEEDCGWAVPDWSALESALAPATRTVGSYVSGRQTAVVDEPFAARAARAAAAAMPAAAAATAAAAAAGAKKTAAAVAAAAGTKAAATVAAHASAEAVAAAANEAADASNAATAAAAARPAAHSLAGEAYAAVPSSAAASAAVQQQQQQQSPITTLDMTTLPSSPAAVASAASAATAERAPRAADAQAQYAPVVSHAAANLAVALAGIALLAAAASQSQSQSRRQRPSDEAEAWAEAEAEAEAEADARLYKSYDDQTRP